MHKAKTLERLDRQLTSGYVPAFVTFSATAWHHEPDACLERIRRAFPSGTVAVRSSAQNEDSSSGTEAGRYLSRLHVRLGEDLPDAIEHVVTDMQRISPGEEGHAVVVQRMVVDAIASGVACTADPRTGAPYLVVTYTSGVDTQTVTSGALTPTWIAIRHGAPTDQVPELLRSLVSCTTEIVAMFSRTAVEIEFAIRPDLTVAVLQARALPHARAGDVAVAARSLRRGERSLRTAQAPAATVLSDMADWNPAEMIGAQPRPLAYSLYRLFITRATWRQARRCFRYAHPGAGELMRRVGARPYVDVRRSLHSLIPAAVPVALREAMLDQAIARLVAAPRAHTAIEFECSVSCHGPCTEARLRDVYGEALTDSDRRGVETALCTLTNAALDIDGSVGLQPVGGRLSAIDERMRDMAVGTLSTSAGIEAIGIPLACAFAVAARHAFVAELLLSDLIACEALDAARASELRASVGTVASAFLRDAASLRDGAADVDGFLAGYGHLRPGTYDVRSLTYAAQGIECLPLPSTLPANASFALRTQERARVAQLLTQCGLAVTPDDLIRYFVEAVRMREYGKFVYSRCVSALLEDVAAWGAQLELTRDDVSFLGIGQVLAFRARGTGRLTVRDGVELQRAAHARRALVMTPSLLAREEQLVVVSGSDVQPAYIGDAHVVGPVRVVGDLDTPGDYVRGCIVCAERADPGYDWLLSAGIKAVITRYGGPNAHLAVRCAELGLPAVIGCGEALFERVTHAEYVEVDCASHAVRPLDGVAEFDAVA